MRLFSNPQTVFITNHLSRPTIEPICNGELFRKKKKQTHHSKHNAQANIKLDYSSSYRRNISLSPMILHKWRLQWFREDNFDILPHGKFFKTLDISTPNRYRPSNIFWNTYMYFSFAFLYTLFLGSEINRSKLTAEE